MRSRTGGRPGRPGGARAPGGRPGHSLFFVRGVLTHHVDGGRRRRRRPVGSDQERSVPSGPGTPFASIRGRGWLQWAAPPVLKTREGTQVDQSGDVAGAAGR